MKETEFHGVDLDPRLKELIMETTAQVLKETGFDNVPLTEMTPEQVGMLCDRMGFEIKAQLTEFFAALQPESLKEHFDVIDLSVEDVKRRFERETNGESEETPGS
jgi:hypothetical protein